MSMSEPAPTAPDSGPEGATAPPAPSDTPVPGGSPGEPAVSGRRPSFTITDAATACAVSRKTITRKLPELALNGAAKDDDGIWRIPVEALLAVGLHPGRSLVADPRPAAGSPVDSHPAAPVAAAPAGPEMVTISRDRWDDVRIRLARAEAEAAERALALADARLALRALTAGPAGSGEQGRGMAQYGSGPIALGSAAGVEGGNAGSERGTGADEPAEDLFDARSHAARNGYAPVTAPPARKRRWWQSA